MAGSTIYDYLMANQPSAYQSLAGALPFVGLPKKQGRYLEPMQQSINALLNPDDPRFQKLQKQNRQSQQFSLAQGLAEAQRQNRKASALGRTPLFDAERGGETRFRAMLQGYQDADMNASNLTRQQFASAIPAQQYLGQQRSQLASNKAGISGNLLGGLVKLFGL